MSASILGRLERVDLREAWKSEANEFTPWLAREENLALLGDAIGIELQLEGQEQNVGPFRADILCKDAETDAWVLIENQLERTDHKHLGQLLTYAAGLQAVTIVWIAENFTEEHRAALDWLNEITDERFNFFGLEVELWRIGTSPIAPKFNAVCKPNDWSRTVSEAASRIEQGEITGVRQLQLEFWTAFVAYLKESGSVLRGPRPLPSRWLRFAIGRSGVSLRAVFNVRDKWVAATLVLSGPDAEAYFRALEREKAEIARGLGADVEWVATATKRRQIRVRRSDIDPANRALWPELHVWMREMLEATHRVLVPRVRQLDLDDVELEDETA